MKRLLITIAAMSFVFSEAPDPKGNWKLSGLSVDYLHIARETTPFFLTADYDLPGTAFQSSSDCAIRIHPDNLVENEDGDLVCESASVCVDTGDASHVLIENPNPSSICIHLQDVPEGIMFNRLTNGPFTDTGLGGIGVNLNVNIYDNGFGTVAQGSFYPDIELSESQACVTDLQIFAVDENFTWELGPESTFSNSNVLGMENGLLCEGDNPDTVAIECDDNTDVAWGFGLVTGLFDATPATPVPTKIPPGLPYVALSASEVLAVSCEYVCANPLLNAEVGGSEEACVAYCKTLDYDTSCTTFQQATGYCAGYMDFATGTGTSSKFNVNAGNSTMCEGGWTPNCNPDVDFKLVWNALDSEETGLGFGDDPDVDEDGDGSDFDRIFGVPYLASTELVTTNPLCDITGGTAKFLTPSTDDSPNPYYNDERYKFNQVLAGDIVSTLGDAGCEEDYDPTDSSTYCCSSGDHPFYGATGTNASSLSAVYDCGESTVAAFIKGNCLDSVESGIEDACEEAGGVLNTVYGGCAQQASGDVLTACNEAVAAATAASSDVDTALAAVIEGACISAGGPAVSDPAVAGGLTCGALASSYATQAAGDCAVAVGLATSTDPNSLCMLAGAIGAGDYSTCADLAASYSDASLDALFESTGSQFGFDSCTEYGNGFTSTCLETAGEPNSVNETEMYLLNPGAVPAQYGFFVTYNGTVLSSIGKQAAVPGEPIYCDPDGPEDAVLLALNGIDGDGSNPGGLVAFPGTHPSGIVGYTDWDNDGDVDNPDGPDAGDIAAFAGYCNPLLVTNDSDHDFDPSCLHDCDGTNDATCGDDCSGRLTLTFEPTCVPEIEARQIVAEFVNLLDVCTNDGDVDYSCEASDWNYDLLADTAPIGDEDGVTTESECQAFAAATNQTFLVNNGPVLPSCDEEEGITTNCTEYSSTVVWNSQDGNCGDGDPNDLITLDEARYCSIAVPLGTFDEAATDPNGQLGCPTADFVLANGATCAQAACSGFWATKEDGVPNFEQSCTVGNGTLSVSDVIRIINHIIGNDTTGGQSVNQLGGEAACAADLNGDGNINVADVVQLVNNIINQAPRLVDASEASVIIKNDKIIINADGYVGGVDMIVEFTDNFSFELADGFASNYAINGNKAHIILVSGKDGVSEVLTMTSGKIVNIEEALVVNSSDFVTTSINQPSIFSVGAAYPNPFNPSTNISLVLNANANLSVKVYNLTGQLVDVIAEGNYSPSSYNWTWKAENLASGVYFIKTQVGSDVSTQKVMLLK